MISKVAFLPINSRTFLALLLMLLALLFSSIAYGQNYLIQKIEIAGTSNFESSEIIFKLQSQVNDPIDKLKITQDIKAIYKLDRFQDVRAEIETLDRGVLLRFVLLERPLINSISFKGYTKISEADLRTKLTLLKGDVFDPVKVKANVNLLKDYYREKGYSRTQITSEVSKISDKIYGLKFVINESSKISITKIKIDGAKFYTPIDIKRFIQSSEIDCFAWVSSSGVYHTEQINYDLALISQHYLKNGYIKVFINKPIITLYQNPDYQHLKVHLNISEGNQYLAGDITVSGVEDKNRQELKKAFSLIKGDVFNPFKQNIDRAFINQYYQERGYAFVRVIPNTNVHAESKTVDVNYHIIKGEKSYIGRINVSGNNETRDYVIRREFEIQEGELYNGKKLKESQGAIAALGYFESNLNLREKRRGLEDNIIDINTELKEAQTGSFQAQLGFSETSGFSGGVTLSKGNLFGRGQTANINLKLSEQGVKNEFSISFREPRLFSSKFSTSVSVSQRTVQDTLAFTSELQNRTEHAFGTTIGTPIYYKQLRFSLGFSALNRYFNTVGTPSTIKRSMSTTLRYRTVNHPTFPSAGIDTFASINFTGWPIGGSTEYREYSYKYQQFWSFNEAKTVVAMFRARVNYLEQTSPTFDIPLEDRYSIGGIRTVRGHDNSYISGPSSGTDQKPYLSTEITTNEAGDLVRVSSDSRTANLTIAELRKLLQGGTLMRIFNLELLFPLTTDEQSLIRGVVFYDAGEVNAESEQYKLLKVTEPGFFKLRHTMGFGIRMITPAGIFRFEFGNKLDARPNESSGKFEFSISGLFD